MTIPSPRYVYDSNVLIEAKNRFYGFDFCPGFWDAFAHFHQTGALCGVTAVRAELLKGKDDLSEWVGGQLDPSGFHQPDGPTVETFGNFVSWVQLRDVTLAAKHDFQAKADGWIAARAKQFGAAVVTMEVSRPASRNSIKIPDLCAAHGIRCIDTFGMLRELDIRFRWAPIGV